MGIGIIGHFGGKKKFNDGQTVKTIVTYDALKRYGIDNMAIVDTYYSKKNPIVFGLSLLNCILKHKKIIVLLSINGRRILFPILYILSKFGKEIYHYAIGGRLAREVEQKPRWKKYVNSFKGNWVESTELADKLQGVGVKNAIYLPNFKKLNIIKPDEMITEYAEPFRFCIFSRVMKEKGIEDAIQAIADVNKTYGKEIAQLDIYGPIESGYDEQLNDCLNKSDGSCKYCGVVEPSKSVEALKDYYMLLFPTHWRHEGIPGTIIDSLSAGVPIISRRWQYCDEMITDNVTGYVYNFDEPEKLVDKIIYSIDNVEHTMKMKKNCLESSYQYSEECVMKKIMRELNI
ncbi:MAG: glycosyltransferase [Clostridia bacterium]|nr:glycosyltransferase [Clostridia bacterium]